MFFVFFFLQVETKNVTRNCESVNITTVNGQYPGPTVEIDEGDTVVVNVTNLAQYEVSIHWYTLPSFHSNLSNCTLCNCI